MANGIRSALRAAGRGPLVGHTTDKTCRIWIRAADPSDEDHNLDENRRTVGVIALLEEDDKPAKNSGLAYFRLHREFDRTGCFNLGDDVTVGRFGSGDKPLTLKPDTEYVAGLATLTIDDPFHNDDNISDDDLVKQLPPLADWMVEDLRQMPEDTKARFRTFPRLKGTVPDLDFIVGSCRYPGLLWKIKQADKIFGPIADQVSDPKASRPVRFVLMVGDQIYADTLNRMIPIGRADSESEFQERYLTAFGSLNMRRLLRTVPHYMILDDHEIEDNWTQDRMRDAGKHRLFNIAISAYMSYQWSHGPRTYGRRLYYEFECGGYPFFVIDTRTQRYKDLILGDLSDNHMLGRRGLDPNEPGQLDHLLQWLIRQQQQRKDAPKFIASSSVFVPNDMGERYGSDPADVKRLEASDSWPAYPNTRRALLESIVKNGIQNVVFLSGDIHCSNLAEMQFSKDGVTLPLKAFSITSSAFYWPFPFADGNPADYVHDSTKPDQADGFPLTDGTVMNYRSWSFTQEDNFCRVHIDKAGQAIEVGFFDADGKVVAGVGDTLRLAPW